MFGGREYIVIVVCRKDKLIEFYWLLCVCNKVLFILKKILFLWGIVVIVDVSVNGVKYLNFVLEWFDVYLEDDE